MSIIARETGLTREGLCKALTKTGDSSFWDGDESDERTGDEAHAEVRRMTIAC
jgi:hypothetical protein